ncbi:NUDIX domain-containing protein [bacterium]|nr:NUDIX domain-containing protein [bacterium]
MSAIRPKVVCVLWYAERMLLIRATDPHDGRSFLLPPGGGVEFGEMIDDAIRRELFEELGIPIENPRRLGMLENVFQFNGRPEHELVFIYDAPCPFPHLYEAEDVEITESNGEKLNARWYTIADVAKSGLPVFPTGLLELLI